MARLSLILLFIFTFTMNKGNAQQKFSVEVSFAPCITNENIIFKYNDGKQVQEPSVKKKGSTYTITGDYYSKYATLQVIRIIDRGTSRMDFFWINSTPAKIEFTPCDSTQTPYTWKAYKLENVMDIRPFDRTFYRYIQKEYYDVLNFNSSIPPQSTTDDSLSKANSQELLFKKNRLYQTELKYFNLHPNDYYSFYKFKELVESMDEIKSDSVLKVTFNNFPEEFKNSFEGKEVLKTIAGKMKTPGTTAIDFTAKNIKGEDIQLRNYRGKYVLLNFWATWCAPCKQEIPILTKIRKSYTIKQLAMLSIDDGEEKEKVIKFAKSNQMNWEHIIGDHKLLQDYGVWSIPKTILIDDKGTIVYMIEGNDLKDLEKILKTKLL